MKWVSTGIVIGTVGMVVALAAPTPADAQIRPQAGFRASYLPLYLGDATVSPIHAWGATVQLGAAFGLEGTRAVEAFYTISPRDAGPHNGAPRVQMVGAIVHVSDGMDRPVGFVGTVGLGMIDVSATALPPCDPPDQRPAGPWPAGTPTCCIAARTGCSTSPSGSRR
jgi:hypothetical protein